MLWWFQSQFIRSIDLYNADDIHKTHSFPVTYIPYRQLLFPAATTTTRKILSIYWKLFICCLSVCVPIFSSQMNTLSIAKGSCGISKNYLCMQAHYCFLTCLIGKMTESSETKTERNHNLWLWVCVSKCSFVHSFVCSYTILLCSPDTNDISKQKWIIASVRFEICCDCIRSNDLNTFPRG